MINGNSVVVQFAKETTYGTAPAMTQAIQVSSESLKVNYEKSNEGLLTGSIASGRVETMSVSAEGDVETLAKPSTVGYFLKGIFGKETVSAHSGSDTLYDHVFTPIGNGESDYLPSYSFVADRKAAILAYLGMIMNSCSFSAEAGDRLKLTVSMVGKNEATGTTVSTLVDAGKSEKSFKFHQASVSLDDAVVADVDSISFSYNNNCDNTVQTTDTGLFHKEPQPGQRECTAEIEALYTSTIEAVRTGKFKTDAEVSLSATFTDDDGNILKFELPVAQISAMDNPTATGADTLKQSMTLTAIDNTTAFCKVTLTNTASKEY